MLKLSTLVAALVLTPVLASAAPADRTAATPAVQVVKIEVTSAGFVPKEVKVKKGVPVRLEVTRKTEKTCAKQLMLKEKNINLELPLDKTVSVTFTPDKAGKLRYACGMDMIEGFIIVE